MQLKLKSIQCESFRTINNGNLEIDEKITVLVGANESGKTNLLEALELLDFDKELAQSDTKINSEYSRKGVLPDIFYEFEIAEELQKKLKSYSKYFEKNNKVILARRGNDEDDICFE